MFKVSITIICIIAFSWSGLIAQIHYVFITDTNNSNLVPVSTPIYYGMFEFQFRDSLSDGHWFLINSDYNDSLTIDYERIIQTAYYTDNLKNGIFTKYNYFDWPFNRYDLNYSLMYLNDTLSGLSYYENQFSFYSKGEKEGIEIELYPNSSKPKFIRNYKNDTLLSWQYLTSKGNLLIYASRNSNGLQEYTYLDSLGGISKIVYCSINGIIKTSEYNRGILVKEVYYEIKNGEKIESHIFNYNELKSLVYEAVIEMVIHYNFFANEKQILEYQNGKVVKKSKERLSKRDIIKKP